MEIAIIDPNIILFMFLLRFVLEMAIIPGFLGTRPGLVNTGRGLLGVCMVGHGPRDDFITQPRGRVGHGTAIGRPNPIIHTLIEVMIP